MKKSILLIVGILINFLLASFSNSTGSAQAYVWKGEIVSEFIESSSDPNSLEFVNVDLSEDPGYAVTDCFFVSGGTYPLPPEMGQIPVRVCQDFLLGSCKERAIYPLQKGDRGSCYFYPN